MSNIHLTNSHIPRGALQVPFLPSFRAVLFYETLFPFISHLVNSNSGEPVLKQPKTIKDLPVTPISHPCTASMGKTGDWRTFRPVIDLSKCTRCLLCWIYCPEGCIQRLPDETPEINYEFCKGCGICEVECRLGAIRMERERE